jgi:hypothetical protein
LLLLGICCLLLRALLQVVMIREGSNTHHRRQNQGNSRMQLNTTETDIAMLMTAGRTKLTSGGALMQVQLQLRHRAPHQTHLAQLVAQVICCWLLLLLLLWLLALLLLLRHRCRLRCWGCLPLVAPLLGLAAALAGAVALTTPG